MAQSTHTKAPSNNTVVSVALPTPLRRLFDYTLPQELSEVAVGSRVSVPFGHQKAVTGVVVELKAASAYKRLKSINTLLDKEPVITSELFGLCQWCADYYHYPLGEVLQLALPSSLRRPEPLVPAQTEWWRISELGLQQDLEALKRAKRQQQALALLQQCQILTINELRERGVERTILKTLLQKGWVDQILLDDDDASHTVQEGNLLRQEVLTLNQEQQTAVAAIDRTGFTVSLLEGVTGSGKTEVYLQAMEPVLRQGKQVLVLVPEIGLTPQTLGRFEQRFNRPIASLHSGLSDKQRLQAWQSAARQQVSIVIGTRSSIFTPMPKLGMIIVDEEHDLSYKQQEGVRYSARDLAVVRARQLGVPVVLGSATPALETLHNALNGRYQHLRLQQRANVSPMPNLRCIEASGQELAPESVQAMRETLSRGLQVLVFINRRGYAPTHMCQDCGWMAQCSACDQRMTLHRVNGHQQLHCHQCDKQEAVRDACPVCNSQRLLAMGMGTQRSEQALESLFADVPVLRIDRDSMARKGEFEAALNTIHQGQPCILIGTQMLAKGHHFPSLGLALIIGMDSALFSSDFRSPERMGQLLTQVAGRTGRDQYRGEVIIQTQFADHPMMRQLLDQGYHDYGRQLLAQRQLGQMPPFEQIALLRAHAQSAEAAHSFLFKVRQQLEASLKQHPESQASIRLLGPFPATIEKRNNRYHHYLQIKSASRQGLRQWLKWLALEVEKTKITKGLYWLIDVDPQEF